MAMFSSFSGSGMNIFKVFLLVFIFLKEINDYSFGNVVVNGKKLFVKTWLEFYKRISGSRSLWQLLLELHIQ